LAEPRFFDAQVLLRSPPRGTVPDVTSPNARQ
jgi:hypothetical protein